MGPNAGIAGRNARPSGGLEGYWHMVQTRGGGTWGTLLSVGEFAAVRETGFEPVGQVFGACVYNIGYTGAFGCAGGWSSTETGPVTAATRVSGEGAFGVRPLVEAMYEARRMAIDRMTAECAVLGGHGVVGVSLTTGEFLSGGLEFQAMGTAVRGTDAPAPPHPFSSDLSGQDFARLIHAGWVPAGVALGISVGARHDDQQTYSTTARGARNAEVDGYAELVSMTRHDATVQLAADVVRMGADGVVVSSMDLRVSDRECPSPAGSRDHFAEVTITGTAIVQFRAGAAERLVIAAIRYLEGR
jgi:uncharacterized protein YbjQ (UPF0145 family)